MKQGWEIKKLGEVVKKLFAGGDKPKLFAEYQTEQLSIPVYANGISLDGLVGYTDKAIVEEESITISARGTIGFCCVRKSPFVPIVRLITLIPSEDIKTEYLYYVLRNTKFDNNGVAIPQLTIPMIREMLIPIPPREEQERIVEELDCLSGVIEKKREQLRELDALAQSIFYTMFGDPNNCIYETRNLSDLSEHKLSYGSGASAVDFDGKIRYVRITDIKDDGELQGDKVSPNVFDDKYTLNDGDILFARSGATVGKTYQYRQKDGKAIYAGYLIRFIPNRNIVLPSYIFGYTKTNYYKAFISASAQVVAQPNINAQQYGALKVPIPPLTLQQEFADKIEVIEKQKALIKQSIIQTEELFNARMDYYFS